MLYPEAVTVVRTGEAVPARRVGTEHPNRRCLQEDI
jgi:hypothetical protein